MPRETGLSLAEGFAYLRDTHCHVNGKSAFTSDFLAAVKAMDISACEACEALVFETEVLLAYLAAVYNLPSLPAAVLGGEQIDSPAEVTQ